MLFTFDFRFYFMA